MTDEARMQRLTELARRVWPDAELEVDDKQALVSTSAEWGFAVTIKHPRALDALEAALLVLTDQGRMNDPSPHEAALHVLAGEPPAWAEQLASEWEERVFDREDSPLGEARDEIRRCAAELRERAKQP